MRLISACWCAISLLTGSVAAGNTGDPTSCPGYKASNIRNYGSTMTVDLTLDGDGCDLYDEDLTNLKLLVEYQTSKSLANPSYFTLFSLLSFLMTVFDGCQFLSARYYCLPNVSFPPPAFLHFTSIFPAANLALFRLNISKWSRRCHS
jgi:hypothetical protein